MTPLPPFDEPSEALDLGSDHRLLWVTKDGRRVGGIIEHLTAAGDYCAGGINFEEGFRGAVWQVEGAIDDHLTISPSVLCSCGDHGFIRGGKWVAA